MALRRPLRDAQAAAQPEMQPGYLCRRIRHFRSRANRRHCSSTVAAQCGTGPARQSAPATALPFTVVTTDNTITTTPKAVADHLATTPRRAVDNDDNRGRSDAATSTGPNDSGTTATTVKMTTGGCVQVPRTFGQLFAEIRVPATSKPPFRRWLWGEPFPGSCNRRCVRSVVSVWVAMQEVAWGDYGHVWIRSRRNSIRVVREGTEGLRTTHSSGSAGSQLASSANRLVSNLRGPCPALASGAETAGFGR